MKKRITAFLLSLVLCLCCISCNRVPDVETVPVSSTDEADVTTEAETDESTPADALRYSVISTGEFEGENAPLFAKTDGDRYIETLTQVKLLDYNSDGSPDWDNGIATIKVLSNEQEGTTTCTIALKDGVLFSDGSKMTVDDLIFTYYVAGDISYDGPYRDAVSILHGLSSYRVNNTGADMVTVTDEMVNASFTEDADVMLAISDQIVRPVLAGEKEWCEENWSSYSDRGYGKSPSDFFVSLYILPMDVNYDSSGKDFDRVIEDAVNLYGADYKSLGMYYRGNSTYFDNDARRIARRTLESKLYGQYGGEEIFSISGIERVDDRTLKLTFDSLIASEVEAALNLPVLSLNHCGNKGYNYEEEYFGVNRGDVSFVRTRSEDAFGAGRYILKTSENTQMIKLIRNERYYALDKEIPKDIKLVYMGSSSTKAALSVGTIDAGRFRINNAEELASVTRQDDRDGYAHLCRHKQRKSTGGKWSGYT